MRFLTIFSIALACLCAFMPKASYSATLSINSIRFGTHPDSTRIVLELSRSTQFRAFSLANPPRIVLDLPASSWKAGNPSPGQNSLIKHIRTGQLQSDISRTVIELSANARIKDAFILPAGSGNPIRLVIDISRIQGTFDPLRERVFGKLPGPAPFADTTVAPLSSNAGKPASPAAGDESRTAYTETRGQSQTLKLPQKYISENKAYDTPPERDRTPYPPPAIQKKVGEKILIVVDAGHGGQDPGSLSADGRVHEKNITLAAAKQVKERLEATGRYRVHLTRSNDVFIKLPDRVKIARRQGADLFISLHADSIDKPGVSGASIYTLSNQASDAQTAKLAARENQVDLIAGVDLSHEDKEVANILIDLAMRDTMNQSKYFANAFVAEAQRRGIVMLDGPHRFAGFAVLKAADIPSVLIEMGFMSNKTEVSALSSPAYRQKIADAIVAGVNAYFAKAKRNKAN